MNSQPKRKKPPDLGFPGNSLRSQSCFPWWLNVFRSGFRPWSLLSRDLSSPESSVAAGGLVSYGCRWFSLLAVVPGFRSRGPRSTVFDGFAHEGQIRLLASFLGFTPLVKIENRGCFFVPSRFVCSSLPKPALISEVDVVIQSSRMGIGIALCFLQPFRGSRSMIFVRRWQVWDFRSIRFHLFNLLYFRPHQVRSPLPPLFLTVFLGNFRVFFSIVVWCILFECCMCWIGLPRFSWP